VGSTPQEIGSTETTCYKQNQLKLAQIHQTKMMAVAGGYVQIVSTQHTSNCDNSTMTAAALQWKPDHMPSRIIK